MPLCAPVTAAGAGAVAGGPPFVVGWSAPNEEEYGYARLPPLNGFSHSAFTPQVNKCRSTGGGGGGIAAQDGRPLSPETPQDGLLAVQSDAFANMPAAPVNK